MTNNNSKVTYIDALNIAIEELSRGGIDPEYIPFVEKLEALKTQIAKRNSAERKPTAKQRANAEANALLGENILTILRTNGGKMTVSEICEVLGGEVSTQKVSAVIKSLGSAVERSVEKRKAYYKVAE
jgi:hypothetical protein